MPDQVCLLRHFPPRPLPQLPLPSLCASTAEPGTPRPSACLCPAQPLLCCPVHPAGSTSLSPSPQPVLPGLRTEQEQGAAPAELQNPAITQLFFFFPPSGGVIQVQLAEQLYCHESRGSGEQPRTRRCGSIVTDRLAKPASENIEAANFW